MLTWRRFLLSLSYPSFSCISYLVDASAVMWLVLSLRIIHWPQMNSMWGSGLLRTFAGRGAVGVIRNISALCSLSSKRLHRLRSIGIRSSSFVTTATEVSWNRHTRIHPTGKKLLIRPNGSCLTKSPCCGWMILLSRGLFRVSGESLHVPIRFRRNAFATFTGNSPRPQSDWSR